MTQETMNDHEIISALADGQLRGNDFVRAVNLLESSSDHRTTWHAYHAVGDMMRTGPCLTIEGDSAFLQRLRLKLAQESFTAKGAGSFVTGLPESRLVASADPVSAGNDAIFRWKAWGGVVSVVALSFVAWQLFTVEDTPRGLAQVAPSVVLTQAATEKEASDIPAIAEQEVMMRDPRLDALLAAHQQLGGTSAFQNPTGFVRSATFNGASR